MEIPDTRHPSDTRTLHVSQWDYIPAGRATMYDPGDPCEITLLCAWLDGDTRAITDLRILDDLLDQHWDAISLAIADYESDRSNPYEPDQDPEDEY